MQQFGLPVDGRPAAKMKKMRTCEGKHPPGKEGGAFHGEHTFETPLPPLFLLSLPPPRLL